MVDFKCVNRGDSRGGQIVSGGRLRFVVGIIQCWMARDAEPL